MRTLLTVSGTIPDDVDGAVASGRRPRPDYRCIAAATNARVVDHAAARAASGRVARLAGRVLGADALVVWATFRARASHDVLLTDGEQIGMPLALLLRLFGRRGAVHVMIVHVVSAPKKSRIWRLLRLDRGIDVALPYATRQRDFLVERLGMPADRVERIDFMVDTSFFAPVPDAAAPPDLICSAGLERRDYRTLCEAVVGLPVQVVIAAGSRWSKQPDLITGAPLPPEVSVCTLGYPELRDLYARSRFVIMPLVDTEFQAGVTTILEAFSMARPVICTATRGQTDVVDASNGVYVPPGDAAALRLAITELLADPARVAALGASACAVALERYDVKRYSERIAEICRRHHTGVRRVAKGRNG